VAAWRNPDIYRKVGLVPERDSVYAFLTGHEFVRATARLHDLPDLVVQLGIDGPPQLSARNPPDDESSRVVADARLRGHVVD